MRAALVFFCRLARLAHRLAGPRFYGRPIGARGVCPRAVRRSVLVMNGCRRTLPSRGSQVNPALVSFSSGAKFPARGRCRSQNSVRVLSAHTTGHIRFDADRRTVRYTKMQGDALFFSKRLKLNGLISKTALHSHVSFQVFSVLGRGANGTWRSSSICSRSNSSLFRVTVR